MIATVDNPSNAVEWALAEMINQPETLERAKKELDQVVGKDRLVQESDLPNLNYIKSCVRESFRLTRLPHSTSPTCRSPMPQLRATSFLRAATFC